MIDYTIIKELAPLGAVGWVREQPRETNPSKL